MSGAVRQRHTTDPAGHTTDDAEENRGGRRAASEEAAAGASTGGGRNDERQRDEVRGEEDNSMQGDRGRDDGRGNDGSVATPETAKGKGGAGSGEKKGGGRDGKSWGDKIGGGDVTRHNDGGRDVGRGDDDEQNWDKDTGAAEEGRSG